jgi:hypothetical protein
LFCLSQFIQWLPLVLTGRKKDIRLREHVSFPQCSFDKKFPPVLENKTPAPVSRSGAIENKLAYFR